MCPVQNICSEEPPLYIMPTFVGVDSLQVHEVTYHVILIRYAIAPEHVPSQASRLQGLPTRVTLDQRDHLRRDPTLVLETPHLQAGLQA